MAENGGFERIGPTRLMVMSFMLIEEDQSPHTMAQIRRGTGLPKGNVGPAMVAFEDAGVVLRSLSENLTYASKEDPCTPVPLFEFSETGHTTALDIVTGYFLPKKQGQNRLYLRTLPGSRRAKAVWY